MYEEWREKGVVGGVSGHSTPPSQIITMEEVLQSLMYLKENQRLQIYIVVVLHMPSSVYEPYPSEVGFSLITFSNSNRLPG